MLHTRLRTSLWALRTRRDSSVLSAVVRDTFKIEYPAGTVDEHLQATMEWLCAAQDAAAVDATAVGATAVDATGDDGVAAFYDVREGFWSPSYPETTGYIIPTFYDYAQLTQDDAYRTRALRMAEWLLPLQLENGAFPIGPLWPDWERVPIIFDTGQIIFGLVRTFEETGQVRFIEAAQRAGDWLGEVQDADGCWRKYTSLGHIHTYNVRVAWALLYLYQVTHEERFRVTAVNNITWALSQQSADGYFAHMYFRPEEDPLTHTIAYTIRGILESGIALQDQTMIKAAQLAADALRQRQKQDGFLRARYGAAWKSQDNWSCLTGNAQMAIIWFKLFELTGDQAYCEAAKLANHTVKTKHIRHSKQPGVKGGVAGSYPLHADYEPYRNLNWAAKFFVDSLLLEKRLVA